MKMFIILFVFVFGLSSARIHTFSTLNDTRKNIPLSTFGFYEGGILNVSLKHFRSVPFRYGDVFGFSLHKTFRYVLNFNVDHQSDKCSLENPEILREDSGSTGNANYIIMDLENKLLKFIGSTSDVVRIYKDLEDLKANTATTNIYSLSNSKLNGYLSHRRRRSPSKKTIIEIPMEMNGDHISAKFLVYFPSEGVNNFYFHNCPNYKTEGSVKVDLVVEIMEKNKNSYLSAGEMPLSAIYFMMSLIFCLSGSFWIYILSKSKHPVYKIHYLMAVLVYLKCLSLLFHSINFHFVQTNGEHAQTWAIIFYITYMLKGAVLFIVILLIGTGWTFIRRGDVLSDKQKKIIMIILPMQVLANIAKIILNESEEGDVELETWWDIFVLVDIFCCAAIMFPIIWTIKHLQETSHTDGKAAMNLRKLKLFRHFYIMVICYFYFTRIIVYILKITVPFQYDWFNDLLRETATFVCFILTGYKFRPASANPYYQVPSEDDEVETSVVIMDDSLAEGLKKVNRSEASDRVKSQETKKCIDDRA